MKQMFHEVIQEGIDKAKVDAEARKPKVQKTESDFGIKLGLEDPYKFLNGTKQKEIKK